MRKIGTAPKIMYSNSFAISKSWLEAGARTIAKPANQFNQNEARA